MYTDLLFNSLNKISLKSNCEPSLQPGVLITDGIAVEFLNCCTYMIRSTFVAINR